MKAMLTDQEHNLVWSDVEEPQVKADSVLIEVHAAAVNRADILQRQGKYPSPAGCPQWMGLEVAGVVVKTGAAVTRWKVGDRVCALLGGGGYAEYAAVTEKMVMPIPQGLSFEEAASLPEAYATCYLNLFIDGGMKAGETVFFPAGNSGLASVGIPMAKAFGAYVITTVRTAEKKEKITHLGADEIIDTSSEAVGDAIERIAAAGHPVDIAVDCVGGDAIGQCLPYVNTGCRWMLISTMGGTAATLPLRALLTKRVMLKGSLLRVRPEEEKGEILEELVRRVWPKIEDGTIRPTIFRVFPIQQAMQAHTLMETGQNVGKLVLTVR